MFDGLLAVLHVLLSTLTGVASTPDAGALGLAVAVLSAVVLIAVVAASGDAPAAQVSGAHPRRAIDLSSPLAQSDPDASGHPRPRAPGSVLPAA